MIDVIQEDQEESAVELSENNCALNTPLRDLDISEISERLHPLNDTGSSSSNSIVTSDDESENEGTLDMAAKRKRYKEARLRARTMSPGVLPGMAAPSRTLKRRLSHHDV